jgi:hypothetical protein
MRKELRTERTDSSKVLEVHKIGQSGMTGRVKNPREERITK